MSKIKVDITKLQYKDMFGRDIKVGDYIVYAGLADRSGVLRAGQVIELTYDKNGLKEAQHNHERWGEQMKLPEPKIRAKSWNYYKAERERDGKVPSGRQKDVTLGFLTRLIVVPESQVSDRVKEDLSGPVHDWKGDPIQ